MRKIYQSPQTEAMQVSIAVTLCASGSNKATFGTGSASGAGL